MLKGASEMAVSGLSGGLIVGDGGNEITEASTGGCSFWNSSAGMSVLSDGCCIMNVELIGRCQIPKVNAEDVLCQHKSCIYSFF
jgi:hypothetical protein